MTITRRQTMVGGAIVGGLVLIAVILWWHNHATARERATPAWLSPGQPPDEVTPEPLSPDASWAANRCRPMVASCGPHSAGSRVRREYPGSLCESDASFVRASVNLTAEL